MSTRMRRNVEPKLPKLNGWKMLSCCTCVARPRSTLVRLSLPYLGEFWLDNFIADNSAQAQGLWASLTAKIINNLQVTVKNIHVRYEDKLSVPGVCVEDFIHFIH
jgi:Vacuolar sorting-associated protein 13, N-terminal